MACCVYSVVYSINVFANVIKLECYVTNITVYVYTFPHENVSFHIVAKKPVIV